MALPTPPIVKAVQGIAGAVKKANTPNVGVGAQSGAAMGVSAAKPQTTGAAAGAKTGKDAGDKRKKKDRDDGGSKAIIQPQAAPPQAVAPVAPAPAPAAPVAASLPSTAGAGQQMLDYDAYTGAGLGKTPAETLALAQAAANQQAQAQADEAIRAGVRGARTAGAMPGQAALATTGVAADAYGKAADEARKEYFDMSKFGATLGSEMSGRLARGEQTAAGLEAAKLQADTSKEVNKDSALDWLGPIAGAVGGIASLFSDERLKEDIEPDDLTRGLDAISGFAYKYKGMPREEAGVMAQDLEKTGMASAVMDTPDGKMVDTRRLSTMNTAALSEHEKRLKSIETMLKHIGGL